MKQGPVQPKVLELTAVITSRTASSVAAQSDGNVMNLPAHTDGYVHQGDLLVQLDVSELRSKLAEAESSRERARGQAGRAGAMAQQAQRKAQLEQRLARTGASSPEAVRAAQAEARAAGSDGGAAGAEIRAAEVQIAEANRLIEAANIKAPMDGTIAQVKVHVGDMARRGQTLVKVFDPADPIVKFALPHNKRDLVKTGDLVQMVIGDHTVNATITTLTDDHDTAIDFFVVTAELEKTNRPADIKVGATGHVRLADKGAVR